ncbi:carbohydrate ABC transporter permease [Streptomyces sp. NBC_01515]|uniref:carbohydrate ABC transporter permease n=1 Tax=Streptomyces sp. NBC_01515 TaxID=2903890 RepID=UPI00386F2383
MSGSGRADRPRIAQRKGTRNGRGPDDRRRCWIAIGSGSRRSRVAVRVLPPPGVPVSLFPFCWLVVMASITTQAILRFPPRLVPGAHLRENMRQVSHRIDFFGSPFNTVVVSVAGTVLVLFFDSLAAFAFAKYEFPARKPLFGILLATYMIPGRLSLVPQFVTMADFGWAGSLKVLVIPGAANAFGIFWMRQYAQNSRPDELLDAFLGMFTFIQLWNDCI